MDEIPDDFLVNTLTQIEKENTSLFQGSNNVVVTKESSSKTMNYLQDPFAHVGIMQGPFARVGSGDPVRVLRLFHNNYSGYCCIHLLCRATYNLSLPRLSANYYGLPTTVQLRAAHKNRCSLVSVSWSTAARYCTVLALNGIITGPFSPPFAGRSLGGI